MRYLLVVLGITFGWTQSSLAQLHDAVRDADLPTVERLLANGADVNEKIYNDFTPLHFATDPEVVKVLLRYHPKLNEEAIDGTPLQAATAEVARGGDGKAKSQKIASLLLEAGAEYDIVSAIHLADLNRVAEILRKNPKAAIGPNDYIDSPLRVAAKDGRVEICKLLLANKADPEDVKRGYGYSILKDAVKYPEVVKILLAAGADVNRRLTWRGGRTGGWLIGDDATVLHFAAAEGAPETIRLLIDHGADVLTTAHDSGETHGHQIPLDVAAQSGKLRNVVVLLEARQFRDLHRSRRCPILNRCLLESLLPSLESDKKNADRPALVEAFLKSGANPNASLKGVPAIQIAASQMQPTSNNDNIEIKKQEDAIVEKVVAVLRAHGAHLDFFSAVALGNEAEVERQLKSDPTLAVVRGADGLPALHFAVNMDYERIVAKLLQAGCPVDIRNRDEAEGELNGTALEWAAFWGRREIAKLLLDAKADANAVDENGDTPTDEAIRLHQKEMLRMLLEHGGKITTGTDRYATPEIEAVLRDFPNAKQ